MAKCVIKYYTVPHDKVSQLPIIDGQLIFVRDAREIFLDVNGERTSYSQIMVLIDEDHRKSLKPVTGFYFVSSTSVLWRYENNQWIPLTTTPREKIVFTDELPQIGVEETLYIQGTAMYRFNEGNYSELGVQNWGTF